MPKRVATPPPGDDEPEYLTVHHPYPLNANWELAADRVQFARWIACCTATKPFYAFFHKPRSRGMVILEIEKTYEGIDGLLGEHRWNDFLRDPTNEEKDRVSQVFYCLYKTGREVQKDGWKRIYVEEAWFLGWNPINRVTNYPYPQTHWCAPPVEDKTNKPLCRPLPKDRFPPPAKYATAPVVYAKNVPGSSNWVNAKNDPLASKTVHVASRKKALASLTIPPQRMQSRLATQTSPVKTSKSPTSNKNTPVITSPNTASTTTPSPWTASTGKTSEITTPGSSTQAPSLPPGLKPKPVGPSKKFIWSDSPMSEGPWWDDDFPAEGGESSDLPRPSGNYGFRPEDFAGLTIGPEPLYDMMPGESGIPLDYVAQWEEEDGEDVVWGAGDNTGQGSLWDDPQLPRVPIQEKLCPVHGNICKKGICQAYANMLRKTARNGRMERLRRENVGKGKQRARNVAKGKGKEREVLSLDSMSSSSNRNDDPWEGSSHKWDYAGKLNE